MAIDLDAIRRKVAQLSGVRSTSSIQLWKPGLGEHKIRCLPWKNAADGQPFIERWFYYLGNNRGFLAPRQFGKPDPIDDLIRKLYASGKPDDRILAKSLQPKMRAYAPVIVRGEEAKGVQVWSFGKMVYQRLLSFFMEEDIGDILDPNSGFDLKVTISQTAGKEFKDTIVDCRPRPSKLMDDAAQVKMLLDSVPNIDDMYPMKSTAEIEQILNSWLNGDSSSQTEGVTRGAPVVDELENLKSELTEKASDASKPAAKPTAKKPPAKPNLDEDAAPKNQSLDQAFEELMND